MLKFEKPDYKVKEYIKDSHYGKFELEPLCYLHYQEMLLLQ